MVTVNWTGGLAFEANPPSGLKFTMDAHTDEYEPKLGPTPVEALLSAVAACSAMDVMLILQKKKQKVHSYRVEVEGDRVPVGTWPRPFLALTVKHIVRGENIDEAALARAVQLSDEKYCTVIATLRVSPKVTSVFEIEG